MKHKIIALLFEAYRRNVQANRHELSKPIAKRWLGLGTEAAYRPAINAGLMLFHDGHTPPVRCMGWLVLTDAGVKAMQEHKKEFALILRKMNKRGYQNSIEAQYQLAGGIKAS